MQHTDGMVQGAEAAFYEALRHCETLCDIASYHDPAKGRKWIEVGYFLNEPSDWPSRSKELVVVARFRALGDASLYANVLARRTGAANWWRVVIR